MYRKWKRASLSLALCAALALTAALAGCSNGKGGAAAGGGNAGGDAGKTGADAGAGAGGADETPFKISIMVKSFNANPATSKSNAWKQIEEYTHTIMDIQFVPDTSYADKLNITLASGNMPMVILADNTKNPSVANAIKAGAFWDLTPYLNEYHNLNQANPIVMNNISFEGKDYAIYRGRPLGRMGISFRKDWLDHLGMAEPKTIDDFYNMLKAFTNNDPDGNGKPDTYGMVVTKYAGPWDIMQIWFGAPNKWGEVNGQLVPDFTTPEYMDALRFFKKLYDEKLVNQDFAVMDPGKWTDPVVNGKAGVIVDVADQAGRLESKIAKVDPKAVIDVLGAVSGPKGLRNLPTSGYSGVFLISKSSVKTEADLKKVLSFLDKLGDGKMQLLAGYGIEGVNYNLDNGRMVPITNDNPAPEDNINDLNQLLMFIPPNPPETNFTPATPLREKVNRVIAENEKIVVGNPAEPLVSQTYTEKGVQLDNIINDARIQFIVGKIDEAGFQDAVALWRKSGGDDYIREINEAYAKVKK